ncbi:MAG: Smr/MutS family protein [Litorivicinaceae bacterium]
MAQDHDEFQAWLSTEGVRAVTREVRVRSKPRVDPEAAAALRARAEDREPTSGAHGLSLAEPPPIDPLKPLEYVAYGIDRRILGVLDQSPFPAQDELDLHGLTVTEAAQEVSALFAHIVQKKLTHIRITHGIGRHSKEGIPVLKAYLNRWLKGNPDIIAFASARRSEGGTGVVHCLTLGLIDDRWRR